MGCDWISIHFARICFQESNVRLHHLGRGQRKAQTLLQSSRVIERHSKKNTESFYETKILTIKMVCELTENIYLFIFSSLVNYRYENCWMILFFL